MGERAAVRRHALRIAVTVALGGLVAACGGGPPAPVIMGGEGSVAGAPGAAALSAPTPAPRAPREVRRVVVRPGQTLSRIAAEYHVPQREIIAVNHLAPPYKIEIGQHLVIPGGPLPPTAMAAMPRAPTLREAAAPDEPKIIPLDGPPPVAERPPGPERPAPPALPAVAKPPSAPSAAEEARSEAGSAPEPVLPHGGHLPWPVHGRILASYGVASGGARNDGINIAAPRGAPVEAVNDGIVAYAGNELRGYGNLVLIKHPNGFISAYAHCEELLVRKGEKVRRGQVIAKVGATGGVSEPQLHFELRRGKQAVDPREFLDPTPSAERRRGTSSG